MEDFSNHRFGEVFLNRRQKLGLSIRQVEKATNIRESYLLAIEASDFAALPRRIYLEKILKKYAEYLDLSFALIEKLWIREMKHQRERRAIPGGRQPEEKTAENSIFKYLFLAPIKKMSFLLTPRLLFSLLTSALVGGVLLYFISLYASISSNPALNIVEPNDNIAVRSDNIIVEGFTEPGNFTTINGKEIAVNPQGYFTENVGLIGGVNRIYIQTTGANGQVSTIERTIIADIADNQPEAATPVQYDDLEVKLVALEPTWFRATIDQKQTVEILLNPGSEKVFEADEQIAIKLGNAGGVTVYVNGLKQDPPGQSGEVVEVRYNLSDFTLDR